MSPAFRAVVLRSVGWSVILTTTFLSLVVAPVGFACLGGPTLVMLCLAIHPLPLSSSSLLSPESVVSLALFFTFLPPVPPVWQDTFLPKHSAHTSSNRPPLVRGMHSRSFASQWSHFVILGSASMMTSDLFGTPFFPLFFGLALG